MSKKTYREFLADLAELEKRIESARRIERDAAIQKIRTLMREYGIAPSELVGRKRGRPPVPPRYRNPETRQTWTGWGARPKWLDGKDSREFLIVRPWSTSTLAQTPESTDGTHAYNKRRDGTATQTANCITT
ncbi:H-NS histone family protein [Paraburkholderia elongata]|uniref:H-NS histone family protein n=1 Tax=Paraburkholderia elongata TaxID=2675747 RepID=UPI001553C2B2|nr:H-NS histone family protein [Paraburkholderia elongata]